MEEIVNKQKIILPSEFNTIIGLEEAKETITKDLTVRALTNSEQKMILLEGHPGVGKTYLVNTILDKFKTQYSDRFVFMELQTHDVTDGVSTSVRVEEFWNKIRQTDLQLNKSIILFIDEADEIFASRLGAQHIRIERTTSLMKQLNHPISNLYIVCCTNRPKLIDRALLDRFSDRINCPLPNNKQLKEMLDINLDFLSESQREIIHKSMCDARPTPTRKDSQEKLIQEEPYKWNGRDISLFSRKLKEEIVYQKLLNPEYIVESKMITHLFKYLINSKSHIKDDYLVDEEVEEKKKSKRKESKKKDSNKIVVPEFTENGIPII